MIPVVSVIIPAYKHRDYILDALDSVFRQTFQDYEVIVVNDGSPDDTGEVLKPLRETGRIHYFEQPNAGQAAARNRGLGLARGEFVAYLDDDDLWPDDKLETQVRELREINALLVGGLAGITQDGKTILREQGVSEGEWKREEFFSGSPFVSPGQTLIRRSVLEEIGGFDETIWGADDYDLYLRIARRGKVMISRKLTLLYRLHPANASKQRERMYENCFRLVARHLPDADCNLSRKAFRWLYDYAGSERIANAKQGLRTRNFGEVFHNLRLLSRFAGPALHDFDLARQIAADLMPARFRVEKL